MLWIKKPSKEPYYFTWFVWVDAVFVFTVFCGTKTKTYFQRYNIII